MEKRDFCIGRHNYRMTAAIGDIRRSRMGDWVAEGALSQKK